MRRFEAYEGWVLYTSSVSYYQNINILCSKNKRWSNKIDVFNRWKKKTKETNLSLHSDVHYFFKLINLGKFLKLFQLENITTFFNIKLSKMNVYWYTYYLYGYINGNKFLYVLFIIEARVTNLNWQTKLCEICNTNWFKDNK
jgi:hypothetical protein